MIVVRFQKSLPLRKAEWFCGAVLLGWGLFLLAQPGVFAGPQFVQMRAWADQAVWGTACALVGIARVTVLAINGAWRASPWARALTAAVCSLFWAAISLALLAAPPATGLVVYPLMIVLELSNVQQAARDARAVREAAPGRAVHG